MAAADKEGDTPVFSGCGFGLSPSVAGTGDFSALFGALASSVFFTSADPKTKPPVAAVVAAAGFEVPSTFSERSLLPVLVPLKSRPPEVFVVAGVPPKTKPPEAFVLAAGAGVKDPLNKNVPPGVLADAPVSGALKLN